MGKTIIKRDILSSIREHLKEKEITLIVGPRGAGKTTILNLLIEELKSEKLKTFYFNLDRESDLRLFDSQEKIIYLIDQETKNKDSNHRVYLFIDELQRRENAGIFLKGIYDYIVFNKLNVKLIATGSGSLELKEKIKESLAGRKLLFEVKTLSFYELVKHKRNLRDYKAIQEFAHIFPEKLYADFVEYLNFGGYPSIVLEEDLSKKKLRLKEIYDSYIERDIKQLLNIERSRSFSMLLKILGSQVGKLVNKAELSRTIGLSKNTVDSYLWYLQKTFILSEIAPFFRNPRKEITKMPVVYFNDLGLRSLVSANFEFDPGLSTEGGVFENFIFRIISDNLEVGQTINFWRTTLGAEVDFVVGSYTKPIPVEVKMKNFGGKVVYGKSFYSFLEKYKPERGYLYNLDTSKEGIVRGINVRSLKFFERLK